MAEKTTIPPISDVTDPLESARQSVVADNDEVQNWVRAYNDCQIDGKRIGDHTDEELVNILDQSERNGCRLRAQWCRLELAHREHPDYGPLMCLRAISERRKEVPFSDPIVSGRTVYLRRSETKSIHKKRNK